MQWIDSSVFTRDLTFNCIGSLFLSAVACIVVVVIEYSNKLRYPKGSVGLILFEITTSLKYRFI